VLPENEGIQLDEVASALLCKNPATVVQVPVAPSIVAVDKRPSLPMSMLNGTVEGDSISTPTPTLNPQGKEHRDIGISNSKGVPSTPKLLQALHNLAGLSTGGGDILNTSTLKDTATVNLTVGSKESKPLGSSHLPSLNGNSTSLQPQLPLGDKQECNEVGLF
jgi:hypothetical protein